MDDNIRKLTEEQLEDLKRIMGNFALENMGPNIWKVPGFGYTNDAGKKLIEKAMLEESKKWTRRNIS